MRLEFPRLLKVYQEVSETWLITGSAGYLGFTLKELLRDHGIEVVALDINETTQLMNREYQADFGEERVLGEIFRSHQIDGIVHLAALKSVSESFARPEVYMQNNYLKTVTLFETAKQFGVERFVFASSAAVYSPSEIGHLTVESDSVESLSPYGESKILCERYFQSSLPGSIFATSLRLFNLAGLSGSTTKSTGVINLLTDCAISGTSFSLNTNKLTGQSSLASTRDYVDVQDVSRAILQAMRTENRKHFTVYNISSSSGKTLAELINIVEEISGRKIDIRERDSKTIEVPWMVGANDHAAIELGWKPTKTLEQTIQQLLGGQVV
jgi:UDP-glucose 4-epimerase